MKKSLIILTAILLLSACQADSNPPETNETSPETITEKSLSTAIEEANYCTVDSDCDVLMGKCPLGCHVLINQSETERIQELIDAFEGQCDYKCLELRDAECVENKCIMESP